MSLRKRIAVRLLEMRWVKKNIARQEQEEQELHEALEEFSNKLREEELAVASTGISLLEEMQIRNAARRQAIYDEEYARVVSSDTKETDNE